MTTGEAGQVAANQSPPRPSRVEPPPPPPTPSHPDPGKRQGGWPPSTFGCVSDPEPPSPGRGRRDPPRPAHLRQHPSPAIFVLPPISDLESQTDTSLRRFPDIGAAMLSSHSLVGAIFSYVLLDYYNLRQLHRRRGAAWLVQRILDTLGTDTLTPAHRFRIRFYGGWYGKSSLSQHGQALAAELDAQFPASLLVATRYTSLRLRVLAELASSMLADPTHDILNTFRRGHQPRVHVRRAPFIGCARPTDCPLAPIESLADHRQCPVDSCSTSISAVFPRQKQQKLVDTMIVSDLIYLACTTRTPVVVVSTDDDLWPGIRTALHFGLPVHHIHTANRTTPGIYASAVTTAYHEYTLS